MVQSRAGTGKTVGLVVRMPEEIHTKIKEAAATAGRSMNSEIVRVLDEYYASRMSDLPPDQRARIDAGESPLLVWREFRGLSSRELAQKAGVPPTVTRSIELGRRFGSLGTTKALADALGITIDDLI